MRTPRVRHPLPRRQQGVALFVTLMILLVTTILGIAAMRLGLTQSVVARNSAVDNVLFQAAEAGLNAVLEEAMTCDNDNTCQRLSNVIGLAATGVDAVRCLTNEGVKVVAAKELCGYTDTGGLHNYLDKRGSVRVYAITTYQGQGMLEGYSSNVGGSATFKTEATAVIPALNVSTTHGQEFAKFAPAQEGLD